LAAPAFAGNQVARFSRWFKYEIMLEPERRGARAEDVGLAVFDLGCNAGIHFMYLEACDPVSSEVWSPRGGLTGAGAWSTVWL
jgi:hypothetical protein